MRNSAETRMAKRFFLSTRKDRRAEADALSEALTSHGWARTFTWTDEDGADSHGHSAIALAELEGVSEAVVEN